MKPIRVALAISIAFLFPLLANMTVQIFKSPPEPMSYYNYYDAQPKTPAERTTAEADQRERVKRFEQAEREFNTFAFYITFPMGILALVGAFFLRKRMTVAAGLMFGSFATIAFASYSAWDTLPGVLRYVTLLFTLALTVFLGIALDRRADLVQSSG